MANPKPATKFKKGKSGNPAGRPPDPPELKALKNLTKAELIRVANIVVKGDMAALKAIAASDKSSVLEAMLAGVCIRIMKRGDMQALNILLDRLIGRVPGKDELPPSTGSKVLIYIPDNGRRKIMKQIGSS